MSYSQLDALIVSENIHNAQLDKRFLTKLGFRHIQTVESGTDALRLMRDNSYGMVLIDSKLSDMDGLSFLPKAGAINPTTIVPLVMATVENRREKVLDAISMGCSGYILRPYTIRTFEDHIRFAYDSTRIDKNQAKALRRAGNHLLTDEADKAVEELQNLLTTKKDARYYFNRGIEALGKKKFGQAIIAFNKAILQNNVFADAYKGLAEAYQAKGNEEKSLEMMQKAASIFAEQGRFQEAKAIFVDIIKHDPNAVNPYNDLGVRLRRKGDFEGALNAYRQGLAISPNDDHIHYNVAKAFLFSGRLELGMGWLERALKLNPDFEEARKLYFKAKRAHWRPRKGEPSVRYNIDRKQPELTIDSDD
ncbi:tetratricopeptide repeat protein [Desulfovibrio inopinatus]|uniref:tetratricopeptide repeat protein n=1 Tax=Desulfovibrio inopinatus TaxID=102109 RepID=UPI0003FA698A|nr:tetratricopeptide repeat protein [Desulfovibrio inopinatus]